MGRGASDIHVKAGDVIRARIGGTLVPLTRQRLTPEQTRGVVLRLLASEEDRARIDALRDHDCSWGLAGVGRFRVTILRQRSSFMIVLRVVPPAVPSLEGLGLPEALAGAAAAEQGLVLVAGQPGSGRTTTVAALVHQVNVAGSRHVVTVEEPIEFLHRDLKASVTQREVGVDTASITTGIRAALRQDADVVVASALPDGDAVEAALKGAEEGRLVLAAVTAPDAVAAFERVVALLPPRSRPLGRARLAEALAAISAQRLVPRADMSGRIALVELLVGTPEVRAALRDPERVRDVEPLLRRGRRLGMQTFDQHATELAATGFITAETARAGAGA